MLTFFAVVAIVALGVQLADTRQRLKRAEDVLEEAARRIGALQRHAGLLPPKPGEAIDPAAWAHATPAEPEAGTASDPVPEPEPVVEPEPADAIAVQAPVAAERSPQPEVAPAPLPPAMAAPAVAAAAAMPSRAELPEPAAAEAAPAARLDASPRLGLVARFEVLFGKQLPIWLGGITLAIAGVLIVKYAIDAGVFGRIFTHGVQVVAGLGFGAVLIGGADFAWRNQSRVRDPRVPQALSGAGIATLYASVLVAATAYGLVSPAAGVVGLSAITALALGLALRFGAPSALLGLVGGLAAPALLGANDPHVPLLAVDLALTIGGLVGVSRMRRWPWLAMAALIGGAGWSLWLVLSAGALNAVAALSTGGLVMVLALAIPVLAFDGPRRAALRSASAAVGALQLAILVAIGGFAPLHWGLFAMVAAAGQALAWRDRSLAIVPTITLALSALLLALWPAPAGGLFAIVAAALAAIHALPLLARMWQARGLHPVYHLAALALAAPALVKLHFPALADAALAAVSLGAGVLLAAALGLGWRRTDRFGDGRFAALTAVLALLLALALLLVVPHWAAPLALAGLGLGLLQFGQWARDPRIEGIAATMTGASLPALVLTSPAVLELPRLLLGTASPGDGHSLLRWGALAAGAILFAARAERRAVRFGALCGAGALAYGTLAQMVPGWSLPLAMAAVAATLFALGQMQQAAAIERLAGALAGAAVVLLALTGASPAAEWGHLVGAAAAAAPFAALRWGGQAVLALVIALRSRTSDQQRRAQAMAVLLGYGFAAQVLPAPLLPLVPAVVGAGLLLAGVKMSAERVLTAVATASVLALGWMASPLLIWTGKAVDSLIGAPMAIDAPLLDAGSVVRRLLIPALLLGGALWLQRARLAPQVLRAGAIGSGVAIGVAVHVLYRLGFAALAGHDFVATGLAQRLGWEALLLGAGWLLFKRRWLAAARGALVAGTGHALVYTVVRHDPLWAVQAVGRWPLVNLLAPAFAMVPLGLAMLGRTWAARPGWFERLCQIVQMIAVSLFGWATLRQGFHGSVLTDPGVLPGENILRSLLLLALAIGFLLWGIRRARHDWRIASLLLMVGAVGKVFLFDASGLQGLLRIGSFVALGFSLIGIGWLYSRQLASVPTPVPTDDQAPAN